MHRWKAVHSKKFFMDTPAQQHRMCTGQPAPASEQRQATTAFEHAYSSFIASGSLLSYRDGVCHQAATSPSRGSAIRQHLRLTPDKKRWSGEPQVVDVSRGPRVTDGSRHVTLTARILVFTQDRPLTIIPLLSLLNQAHIEFNTT